MSHSLCRLEVTLLGKRTFIPSAVKAMGSKAFEGVQDFPCHLSHTIELRNLTSLRVISNCPFSRNKKKSVEVFSLNVSFCCAFSPIIVRIPSFKQASGTKNNPYTVF